VGKRTDSPARGSLANAALTGASLFVVTGVSAVLGIVIARKLGRTEETDGFFAGYGVFIVVLLASYAVRVAVLPELARARAERRLASEVARVALALAVVALPVVLAIEVAAGPLASVLTGGGSPTAHAAAVHTLRWTVPAGFAHVFAAVAASTLAALDDYGTAALGYSLGSAAGLSLVLLRVDENGLDAVLWGVALNAAVALLVPVLALAARARRERIPVRALHPGELELRSRLVWLGRVVSLPFALQLLFVVCLPFAAREGVGAQTSFSYAYLAASALVAVTAASVGLATSVPLARIGLDPAAAARHVVSSSWVAYSVIGAAVGVVALVGASAVEAVLGTTYGGDVGSEIGWLIAGLSPWMAVSVGVSLTFPLVFVAGAARGLPRIAMLALAAQVLLAFAGQVTLGLEGLALALAASTAIVLGLLLQKIGAYPVAARELALAALAIAAIAAIAFAPFAFVEPALGALLGLALYAVLLRLVHPRGLTAGWRYLRALS
jgi:hypothetical protein